MISLAMMLFSLKIDTQDNHFHSFFTGLDKSYFEATIKKYVIPRWVSLSVHLVHVISVEDPNKSATVCALIIVGNLLIGWKLLLLFVLINILILFCIYPVFLATGTDLEPIINSCYKAAHTGFDFASEITKKLTKKIVDKEN